MLKSRTSYIIPSVAEIEEMARRAGKITLGYFRKNLTIVEKGNNQGIVTDADLASENEIIGSIRAKFPTHTILAEESGLSELISADETPLWIIDPLDGTTNFSKGNPYYCVSIGFGIQRGQQCEILAGAIFQPTTGDMYLSEKGKGSFCNGEQISVANVCEFGRASIVTGFSSNRGSDLEKVIKSIHLVQEASLGTRLNGAAALDMAMVARGIFNGFYEKSLAPWDMAAGSLILSEAGANVTNFQGEPFSPLEDKDVIAAYPKLHEKLFGILSPIFK